MYETLLFVSHLSLSRLSLGIAIAIGGTIGALMGSSIGFHYCSIQMYRKFHERFPDQRGLFLNPTSRLFFRVGFGISALLFIGAALFYGVSGDWVSGFLTFLISSVCGTVLAFVFWYFVVKSMKSF